MRYSSVYEKASLVPRVAGFQVIRALPEQGPDAFLATVGLWRCTLQVCSADHPDWGDGVRAQRLAALLMYLAAPDVPRVRGLARDETERPVLIMDCVDGASIDSLGRLPVTVAVAIVVRAARALGSLLERGLSLSSGFDYPQFDASNVLLAADGRVVLGGLHHCLLDRTSRDGSTCPVEAQLRALLAELVGSDADLARLLPSGSFPVPKSRDEAVDRPASIRAFADQLEHRAQTVGGIASEGRLSILLREPGVV